MNTDDAQDSQVSPAIPSPQFNKHDFDMLDLLPRSRIVLSRACEADLEVCANLAAASLGPSLASLDVVRRIVRHNADQLLVFKRKGAVVGAWAMLLLREEGLSDLIEGVLDASDPNLSLLAAPYEKPAGIYVWAIFAPRMASDGIRHVSAFLRQPQYIDVDIYSRAATPAGALMISTMGCRPHNHRTGLHRYVRVANRQNALRQAA